MPRKKDEFQQKVCANTNCSKAFIPNAPKKGTVPGRQKYCSRRCGKLARSATHYRKHADQYAVERVSMRAGTVVVPTRPMPLRCEICGRPPHEVYTGRERLDMDHDHITGQFRGWLCSSCNMALGKLGDNPNTLLAAARYLENVYA